MEWEYKRIKIEVNEDGLFTFWFNSQRWSYSSFKEAKSSIDTLLFDYYDFNKDDYRKLLGKLSDREKDFVKSLVNELAIHQCNAYCEIGISEDFLFMFSFDDNRDEE